MADDSPDFTATPRAPQPYAFTPISQLPGGSSGAPATGEEGGEAPPGVQSAPLLSPRALNLSTLQRRASPNRDTGPNEVQDDLNLASKSLRGLKAGAEGAKFSTEEGSPGRAFLNRLFGDAGFLHPEALIDPISGFLKGGEGLDALIGGLDPSKFDLLSSGAGAALNPGDFSFDIGTLNQSLPDLLGGESGAAGTAGAETAGGSLGDALPYVNAALAALNIGRIAFDDNLQDDQKAVGAAGAGLAALAPVAAGAAASAAGLGAGAAAGAAAPVGMILAMIAQHIMESMEHVPHEVREAMDFDRSRDELSNAREGIDQAWTLDDLGKWMQRNTSGYLGGGFPGQQSAYMTELNQGGQRRWFGKPNANYPVVGLQDLLADPEHVQLSWQHGLSGQYMDPVNKGLTKQLRDRLVLLGRAEKGDPEAMMALQVAKARFQNWARMRDARQKQYEEGLAAQDRERGFGDGDSGDASA